jgi:hypothetical protein
MSPNMASHSKRQNPFFHDTEALIIPDPDHSTVEERFVMMG